MKKITFLIICSVFTGVMFAQNTVTLDDTKNFQTITGWEATAQAWALDEVETITNHSNANPLFSLYQNELFDALVDTLGVNRVRLEVMSGCENPVDYFTQYLNGQITFTQYH